MAQLKFDEIVQKYINEGNVTNDFYTKQAALLAGQEKFKPGERQQGYKLNTPVEDNSYSDFVKQTAQGYGHGLLGALGKAVGFASLPELRRQERERFIADQGRIAEQQFALDNRVTAQNDARLREQTSIVNQDYLNNIAAPQIQTAGQLAQQEYENNRAILNELTAQMKIIGNNYQDTTKKLLTNDELLELDRHQQIKKNIDVIARDPQLTKDVIMGYQKLQDHLINKTNAETARINALSGQITAQAGALTAQTGAQTAEVANTKTIVDENKKADDIINKGNIFNQSLNNLNLGNSTTGTNIGNSILKNLTGVNTQAKADALNAVKTLISANNPEWTPQQIDSYVNSLQSASNDQIERIINDNNNLLKRKIEDAKRYKKQFGSNLGNSNELNTPPQITLTPGDIKKLDLQPGEEFEHSNGYVYIYGKNGKSVPTGEKWK